MIRLKRKSGAGRKRIAFHRDTLEALPENFSMQELARQLHVAYVSVYLWVHLNSLPYVKCGNSYLISRGDLIEWMKITGRVFEEEW